MSTVARKWNHLSEPNIVCASGDAALDAKMRNKVFSARTGNAKILMLYDSDVTLAGTPLRTGRGTPASAIDPAAFIQRITEAMSVAGTSRPFIVVLDFEQDFYGWLNGYGTVDQENAARNQHINAINAARAVFGSTVQFGIWGLPDIHYDAYRDADAAGKALMKSQAVTRFAPMVAVQDFQMPSVYEFWPTPQTMDPLLREYVVRATGTEAIGLTPAQFGPKWEEGALHDEAEIDVALAINALQGTTKPVYISLFGYFSASASLAFVGVDSGGTEGAQFVPRAQVLQLTRRLLRKKGVTGYNWWWPASFYTNYAFVSSGASTNVQNGIIDAFYGGISPIPSRFSGWADPAFRMDFSIRYNKWLESLMRQIQNDAARRHTRVEHSKRPRYST